ncbi:ABC transporter ATP-binding protein [Nonomuraea sp. MCN248]|uniref:ABC transporter ATP-binding protein n=1 Tax=Nonomuraea corallina TaxID=2989783 RepID=A0ABT4S8Q2_9ACTN|nr:ABC transporter ATP-binding protein [Nonomuraea corallina]MDA0633438.1 ABC transporter ATP-binding protein [Nonomuraea corallina]
MLLSIRELTSGYGRIPVLRGVDLDVAEGEIVALLGVNGAGKSTTLRAVSGVLPTWSGTVSFDGTTLGRRTPEARARLGLGHVPEGRGILSSLTVRQNLRLGATARGRGARDVAQDEERLLEVFDALRDKLGAPAGSLSGGQQQMLAVARALIGRPRLVMVDEMSFGLAPILVTQLLGLVARLRAESGTAFLLVEQHSAVLDIADRAYVLSGGAVHTSGPAHELAQSENLVRAYLG